jgi:hypothetical protein
MTRANDPATIELENMKTHPSSPLNCSQSCVDVVVGSTAHSSQGSPSLQTMIPLVQAPSHAFGRISIAPTSAQALHNNSSIHTFDFSTMQCPSNTGV